AREPPAPPRAAGRARASPRALLAWPRPPLPRQLSASACLLPGASRRVPLIIRAPRRRRQRTGSGEDRGRSGAKIRAAGNSRWTLEDSGARGAVGIVATSRAGGPRASLRD